MGVARVIAQERRFECSMVANELIAVHPLPTTMLLVASDNLMSLGLQALFAEQPTMELLHTVQQPDVAVQTAAHDHLDVIIIDATIGQGDLVVLTRMLRDASP